MKFLRVLAHWLVSAAAVMATAYLIPGLYVGSFRKALAASVLIGLGNILIRPFLLLLTLPINILTLGLFTFVVNGAVLKFCAFLAPQVIHVSSWGAAILGALVLSIIAAIFHALAV